MFFFVGVEIGVGSVLEKAVCGGILHQTKNENIVSAR